MNGVNEVAEMPFSEDELIAAERAEGVPASEEATSPAIGQGEYDQVKRERDQLLDRIARMQAEFDNARKREAKERNDFRDYATGSAAEGFLPVLDNFQLAMKSTGSPEQFRTGVELIAKQLEEAIRNLGITPVDSVGTQFDPRFHEALGKIDTVEYPDGAVIAEVRRGYRIKDRLLRPALVQVASNPAQHEA